jgi:peptide deformylase
MWEGCISSGAGKAGLFAKVPRYEKIELEYLDESAVSHKKVFSGLVAHVIQHEVDHLNGILFVDKVKDSTTFMTYSEYRKMKKKEVL